VTAVDLFCGAGGASLGLVRAGWDLRLAADADAACSRTHQANLPGAFLTVDLRTVDADTVGSAAGVSPGLLDLLFAGPPCQGFSIIGSRVVWDERNNLFKEVLRLAAELRPRCVVIENVPGLATLARGAYLHAILEGLSALGYETACAELLAAQYGAPQMRWRLIIIGWRKDLGIPPGYGFPRPTAGTATIGELLPNCTIPPRQLEGFVTTAEAIGDLPPVAAGEEATHYVGPPAGPYQQTMRAGLNGQLSNHYAARLSAGNLTRLAHIKPGQDWRDRPRELLPTGMQRALRKDHTRRYRRMTWDGVPRAVITRFRDPKSGEYTHPDQDRTITIREAARLQGFPDSFVFHGDRTSQYEQVGNAVPVQLAEAIVSEIRRCLDGQLGERLYAPFRRRPIAFLGTYGELSPSLPDCPRRWRPERPGLSPERRIRLADDPGKSEILDAVHGPERVFVYFQDKLGGEISLSKTGASPELSFDITVVELLPARPTGLPGMAEPAVTAGKYGVIVDLVIREPGGFRTAGPEEARRCGTARPASRWQPGLPPPQEPHPPPGRRRGGRAAARPRPA
jgi:DNA (cytosine-5)-methyltransferase 1